MAQKPEAVIDLINMLQIGALTGADTSLDIGPGLAKHVVDKLLLLANLESRLFESEGGQLLLRTERERIDGSKVTPAKMPIAGPGKSRMDAPCPPGFLCIHDVLCPGTKRLPR